MRRAVGKAFRREFINRLDRVVVFRPLSRELMREILQKELVKAFQRRGLRYRSWAVEWDETAIEFLLEKGFTPDLGARPLKRAIERYLLSPLAITIVRHQAPAGDQFLFVSAGEERLEVTFVDPDAAAPEPEAEAAAPAAPAPDGLDPRAILLDPRGSAEELAALRRAYDALDETLTWPTGRPARTPPWPRWSARTSGPRPSASRPWAGRSTWTASTPAAAALARCCGAWRATRPAARCRPTWSRCWPRTSSCWRRPAATSWRSGPPRPSCWSRPARTAPRTGTGPGTSPGGWPGCTRPGPPPAACAWPGWESVEDDDKDDDRPAFRRVYSVMGFGAHSLLAGEHGLHLFEWPGDRPRQFERVGVHVRVAPQPAGPPPESRRALLRQAQGLLEAAGEGGPTVVRRYREAPTPLVRDARRDWRSGRLDRVLAGDFDLMSPPRPPARTRRHTSA